MALLYVEEHVRCSNFQKEYPPIKNLSFKEGEMLEYVSSGLSRLIFVKKGSFTISLNEIPETTVYEKEIVLLPSNSKYKTLALEEVYVLVFEFQVQVNLCENFSMTQLSPFFEKEDHSKLYTLKFNEQMSTFVDSLDYYAQDSILCKCLYEAKKEELFILLRAYYPKELLAAFFSSIIDKVDLYFKNFVLEKCLVAKNIQELASMANYSTSGFIKKFTRSFNESPYKWISHYKANRILYEINAERKPLKEIYTAYKFSSMPHFISFCKKQYGLTPGKIRKDKKQIKYKG